MKKLGYVLMSLATLYALSRLLAEPYRISGDCMEPEYKDGDSYFLNRLTPYIWGYKTGDVVLYKHEDKVWISRIVAHGGETIHISDKKILVNGSDIQEPESINRSWPGWNYGTFALNKDLKVPNEHFFVLSDKLSAQHDDSRVFGTIAIDDILGVVWTI